MPEIPLTRRTRGTVGASNDRYPTSNPWTLAGPGAYFGGDIMVLSSVPSLREVWTLREITLNIDPFPQLNDPDITNLWYYVQVLLNGDVIAQSVSQDILASYSNGVQYQQTINDLVVTSGDQLTTIVPFTLDGTAGAIPGLDVPGPVPYVNFAVVYFGVNEIYRPNPRYSIR